MNCIISFFSVLVLVMGCSKVPEGGVPNIEMGKHNCERCGMIISEDRFASGYINSQGESIGYDDLGEAFEAVKNSRIPISKMYVVGMKSLKWIPMTQAHFVHVSGFATPMGSGVVAFETLEDAAAFARQHKTSPKNFDEMLNHLNSR